MEQHQFGLREWADLCERKDATIAALQADNRTYIDERHEHMKQIEQLQARVQELEQWVQDQSTANLETMRHTDEMQSRAMEAEQQLTQRTAELEAAKAELNTVRRDAGLDCGDHSCLYAMNKTGMRTNGGCRCSPKRMKNDLERSRKAYDDLQAELERVRGELAEERTAYKALSEQYNRLDLEHSDLRTLLLALPKVEGEIRVEEGKVISVEPVRGADPPLWWRRTNATFEDGLLAKHYSKLLQHRQGMEG